MIIVTFVCFPLIRLCISLHIYGKRKTVFFPYDTVLRNVPHFGRRRFIFITRQYKMEDLEQICNISVERMRGISAYVQDQMNRGLRGEPSDLKMLPSFVDSICTGKCWMRWMMNRNGTGLCDGSGYGWKQCACDQV